MRGPEPQLAGCFPPHGAHAGHGATAAAAMLRAHLATALSRHGGLRGYAAMSGRPDRGGAGHDEGERGGPPWARHGGFPFGGPGGLPFGRPPFGPWRANKARRGDVRTAVLAVLAVEPRNGYQVIQQIAERTDGAWKPSPGSVYPTLQQLEDEGLVRLEQADGRRLFHLTEEGRTYVEEHADELAATWETVSEDSGGPSADMSGSIGSAMAAVWQVIHSGTDAQRAQAREVLERTRRDMYKILADGNQSGTRTDDSST